MNEFKPNPGGQTIVKNSKEFALLTTDDIQIIKNKFKKKRKITYYCMIILFLAGALLSTYAVYGYGFSRFENFVPLIVGFVAVLVCILVLVMFKQEQNLELKNNRKIIYQGIVSMRSGKATTTGTGQNKQTTYSNYVHLGDEIRFDHEDIYYQVNEGDTIDVHISEKLNYVLYKNIVKKKAVADIMPEVIEDYGFAQVIKSKSIAKERTEPLTDEELIALKTLKQRRSKRLWPVAIILTIVSGVTGELILAESHYILSDMLAIRFGFWGISLAFFALLIYRRLVPLKKDIKSGLKTVISDKVVNKHVFTWSSGKTDYTVIGSGSKTEVSSEFLNSLEPAGDFELHKTKFRKKLLFAFNPKNQLRFYNSEIFVIK